MTVAIRLPAPKAPDVVPVVYRAMRTSINIKDNWEYALTDVTRRRRRWPIVTGVIALLGAAGVAGALSLREPGEAGAPPARIAEGFPPVAPPSFDGPSASPSTVRSAAPKRAEAPGEPITAFSACSTGRVVTFKATFAERFDYHHVFIDADGDASTGYLVDEIEGGFGADYMLENELFYESTGTGWDWREVDGVSPLIAGSGRAHRWQLRPDHAGVRAVFNASRGAGTEIFTPVVPVRDC